MKDIITPKERLSFKRSWKEIIKEIFWFLLFFSAFFLGGIHV